MKKLDFISTELLSFLYLNASNDYSNFINFNDDIEIVYLAINIISSYTRFLKGDVGLIYAIETPALLYNFYSKRKKLLMLKIV